MKHFRRSSLAIQLIAMGLLVAMIMLAACSRIRVRTEIVDKETDVSQFRTYAWQQEQPGDISRSGGRQINQLSRDRVQRAFERSMKEKGYLLVKAGQPDILLRRRGKLRERESSSNRAPLFNDPGTMRGDPDYEPQDGIPRGETARHAKLILEVLDPSDESILWRGSAKGVVDELASPDREIRLFVSRLMSQFPEASR